MTDLSRTVNATFEGQFTDSARVDGELVVFNREDNNGFERTYGWAWFLKLQSKNIKTKLMYKMLIVNFE